MFVTKYFKTPISYCARYFNDELGWVYMNVALLQSTAGCSSKRVTTVIRMPTANGDQVRCFCLERINGILPLDLNQRPQESEWAEHFTTVITTSNTLEVLSNRLKLFNCLILITVMICCLHN